MAVPIVLVESGAPPITNVGGAAPFTPVAANAPPFVLVDSGGMPMTLVNEDGSLWRFGYDTPAGELLTLAEASGFAFDALEMDALVRWEGNAASQFAGDPNNLFTRPSPPTQYIRNASGLLVPGTTLRCDHAADGTPLGLLIEGQRTNEIRNNSMQGVAAGSPGTLPIYWVQGNGNGLTRTIVGSGTENGTDYVDIRFAGTTSDTNGVQIGFDANGQIVAASGDTWTESVSLARVGGSTSNISEIAVNIVERTSAGNYVTEKTGSDLRGSLGATLSRFSTTQTLTGGGTVARAQPRVRMAWASGVAIDITLRFGWPQFEKANFASSPIRTTNAAVTRAANDISLLTSLIPMANDITVVCEFIRAAGGSGWYALEIAAASRSDAVMQIVEDTGNVSARALGSGFSTQALVNKAFAANTVMKMAMRLKQDDFAVSWDGAAATTDTNGTWPAAAMAKIQLGDIVGTGFPFGGHLRKLIILPRGASNSQLATLSAH